ncbi:DNA polymerase III subunit alpha [Buchnera aphidicola (Aphis helianthi)]|uniref:DNA polymerase III subunit alpha n=1 Tax=Buchnera aphidicola (Aphis helianthi) TaxID=2315802 RepID=A0A4D6XJ59_9GAMM|nr:DNA polymerase III subunit alpha [Buchnera aphidicola]QCI17066.1 DNA polymerase III subunit alpha [Buchnera aphidicola (Aphis helianthi)]
MSSLKFVHLHVHSDYSIFDGLSKPEDLVKKAFSFNMMALALTDFSNLYGVIKFYNSAHKWGLKPIIGTTVKFVSEFIKNDLVELTILASNQEGYKNLITLISRSYKKGYINNKSVTIKKKWLTELNNGLILLSGGCQGEIGKVLLRSQYTSIYSCLKFYETYFPSCYYLELIRTGRKNEEKYLHLAVDLSYSKGIPVVATNDVCFLNEEDFKIHKIRIAIHEGEILKNSKIQNNYSKHQFLKSEEQIFHLFSDIPEALVNSVEIAKRCNVFISSGKYFLPQFQTGKISVQDYLVNKAKQGLKKRLRVSFSNINIDKETYLKYKNRLVMELNIINKMGFPGYFLIVMEFIQWAKNNNIPVGPGRGSGAGSLVAYVLNITEIDPLLFNLLFERFLNPERISLPDFDIDFCMDKRDKVIEHVSDMYGRNAVAQIITFGTMTAKAVIRDVGRVLGYPYGFINNLSKLVPLDPGITLDEAFSSKSELYNLYKNDEDIKKLIDISKKLEGVTRNIGKHAGGVVISPTKITDFCPLYCDESGNNPVTQFDKNDIEYVGLLKFDFLGLRTLTTISCTVDMINSRLLSNQQKININSISLNDKKCFYLLKKCKTTAIFQLESHGMKDLIKKLKPDCFEDIIALLALFRPGPLQSGMVDNFINRKHGYEKISYPDHKWQHILLKPVLESTYGIILYQEQVMQIAQILAGYTLGKADILRRAMSKKDLKDMEKQRKIFLKGCEHNSININLATKIFDLLEKFAGYGFNKSHSVAYALVSYQTLWLKTYYPAEFIASTMNSDIDNTEKIIILVNEAFNMKLKIIPPNLNLSKYEFYVDYSNNIIYGLGAIKGIGENSIKSIIKERDKNGCFYDLFDLCIRCDLNKINRRILEKLIMSGSLDSINKNRNQLLNLIENAIKVGKEHKRIKNNGQASLFGTFQDELKIIKKNNLSQSSYFEKDQLKNEYQVLGFYLTAHPINQYEKELKHYINKLKISKLKFSNKIKIVSGIVVSVKVKTTKNKNKIVILILDNYTSRIEVLIFKKVFNLFEHLIKVNEILIIQGTIDLTRNSKIIAHDIMNLMLAREKYVQKLIIILTQQNDELFLKKIYQLLEKQDKGSIFVDLFCKTVKLSFNFIKKENFYITVNNEFLNELKFLVGSEKIQLKFY